MAGFSTINPWGMTAKDWTDAVNQTLDKYGAMMKVVTDEDWRDWALNVTNNYPLSAVVLPNPYDFDDWRSYAQRFNQIMDGWTG